MQLEGLNEVSDNQTSRLSAVDRWSRLIRYAEFDQRLAGGKMQILSAIAQLRTTDLAESIRFYTTKLGLTLEFQYENFYAGIRAGSQLFHLKLVDQKDPSIDYVDKGEHFHLYLETDDAVAVADQLKRNGVRILKDVHETAWGTREFVIIDNQGHTLYFGERRQTVREHGRFSDQRSTRT